MVDEATSGRQPSTTDEAEAQSIPEHVLFGRSKVMQEVRQAVHNVKDAFVPILLQGEKGTGKEVIGREIHRRSLWRSAPFIKFATQTVYPAGNAASPWAFTSQPPDGAPGTLFIDEVGDLDPVQQLKLLEFFQEEPVFSNERNKQAYRRVICTTYRNLDIDVGAGVFRLDLFYRINVVTIHLPSLRERKEDIPGLTAYLFEVSCRRQNRCCKAISNDLLHILCQYDWPGNIRELKNWVRTYVTLDGSAVAVEALLSKQITSRYRGRTEQPKKTIPLRTYTKEVVEKAEKDLIYQVLMEKRWNRREAAKALQVSYQTLLHKLKQAGLTKKNEPAADGADNPAPEDYS